MSGTAQFTRGLPFGWRSRKILGVFLFRFGQQTATPAGVIPARQLAAARRANADATFVQSEFRRVMR